MMSRLLKILPDVGFAPIFSNDHEEHIALIFFLVMWSLRILLFLWHMMWVPPDKQKSCKVQTQTTESFIAVLFLVLTLIDMSEVI